MTEQGFCPPAYRTVARFLEHQQADLVQARQGDAAVYAYLPQIQRNAPTERNAIWTADATAHNELVFYEGRTRQYVYGVYVFDCASGRALACAPYNTAARKGQGERAEHYFEALSAAIRATGCCPQVLQIDRGPAFQETKKWCELRGIKAIPTGVKNARPKRAEGFFSRMQHVQVRYRASWSGQNRTSRGLNSQPSPEQLAEAAKQAPTAEDVMAWMRTKQLAEYNAIPFKQWNRKPCGQSPDELWAERAPATAALSRQQLATYAGHCHRVKFTKEGLRVQCNEQPYTYYPDISSDAARAQALELFAELKMRSPSGSKRTLYILDYTEGAYVFDKAWQAGGTYKGYWPLQQKVEMMEALSGATSQRYKDLSALQRDRKAQMKAAAKAAQEWTPLKKERLQGRGASRQARAAGPLR